MPSLKSSIILIVLSAFLYSCVESPGEGWVSAVPEHTSFVIVPESDATIQSVVKSDYIPFLEDISNSAVQLVSQIDSTASTSMTVQSILLYPGTDQKFQPIWITGGAENLEEKLKQKYARDFTRNEYQFHDTNILNLHINDRQIFVASLDTFTMISESSLGIENAIRAHEGRLAAADLSEIAINPASVIVNTPALDKWISQLARVTYQPIIKNVFKSTKPGVFTVTREGEGQETTLQLSGEIGLSDEEKSSLTALISEHNKALTLDEYISSNAAAFGIFHTKSPSEFPGSLPDTTATDSYLMNNTGEFARLAETLNSELAMVMYAESGYLSEGEYVFIRRLNDADSFRRQLEALTGSEGVKKMEGLYFVQSFGLAQLLGSQLCNFSGFYINIMGEAAVISKRRGLAELVASDRSRRRVVTYEPFYEELQSDFAEELSSLFVAGPEFNRFLEPFLATDNYVDALTSTFNYMSLTTRLDESDNKLTVNLSTYKTETADQPFRENWIYNTRGSDLSGPPAFGNVGGSGNDEVVFATKQGDVYALAADGTVVEQYSTGSDEPIGSPVIYDWFGTGQNVVLIAAGNKIYGWDENGESLPKFPFTLNEAITTPLTVADLDNDRLPDAIVGTADRKLHALSGRGTNLSGWPVTTNAPINSAPLVTRLEGAASVVAFSANTAHAWDVSGRPLSGYPVFINANFTGSPAMFQNSILGGGVDGNLYAIGDEAPFADSLDVFSSGSSASSVKGIYVSNNALSGTPAVSGDRILTTGSNGSIFMLNEGGQLLLTENMGQPSASDWSSKILDINSDGTDDIVALADFGRLYAWNMDSGERIFDLPTAGMSNLNIGDIDGDGLKELVAQTREGVRSWTIGRN